MSENQDDTRTMGDDGTQQDPENMPGGYGPSASVGGEQEPGGPVPPYDDRQQSQSRDGGSPIGEGGAYVGGAKGPTEVDGGLTNPDPSDTPGGRTWGPGDQSPDTEPSGDRSGQDDAGAGPGHVGGTPRAEDHA
ncbi:MAG: hypothetical protein DLM59_09790 [Pseudonocardiales bacterium]|nr:MAG: hypothetical protein DLM59_09790 [Pseudonocardiales bacterium]